jgi:DNA polymerase-1
MQTAFRPRTKFIREITPSETKHGTLHKKDFKWVKDGDLTPFVAGAPFSLVEWVDFNPGSPKQVVRVLNEAGWRPVDKTKGHIEFEREAQRNRRNKKKLLDFELEKDHNKIEAYEKFGWKINEKNLQTLPDTAPAAAKALAKRIMLESRRKTLVEWIELCDPQSERIHGKFQHIGAWTHRMSHQNPNTANIPREDKLFGKDMRSLWRAQPGRLLIGVDAEGIQLRVLAHYIDDPEFTHSVIFGKKQDGTDPHSLNMAALGQACRSRDDAKTFIYAWLLGAGISKVAEILKCSNAEAKEAVENFLRRFEKLKRIKEEVIPYDARRGYFEGFDGRFVRVPGEGVDDKKHLMLSGYLQNGEAIVMKKAVARWHPLLIKEKIPFWFVNLVHDEYQTETINDMEIAKYIANVQAESIRIAGEELGLKCPMAGSVLNTHGKLAIGSNWLETH